MLTQEYVGFIFCLCNWRKELGSCNIEFPHVKKKKQKHIFEDLTQKVSSVPLLHLPSCLTEDM